MRFTYSIFKYELYCAVRNCILLVVFLLSILFPSAGIATQKGEEELDVKKNLKSIEDKWGIKILSVRLTANSYMLDFRYRVVDSEKAAPLFSHKIKPYLIDEASGSKFFVPNPPKVGSLRHTRKPSDNKNYFIIFANPARYVKKGNKVTIVIGDFKVENITVE